MTRIKINEAIEMLRRAATLVRAAEGLTGDLETGQAADELVRLQARLAGRYGGHELVTVDAARIEVQR